VSKAKPRPGRAAKNRMEKFVLTALSPAAATGTALLTATPAAPPAPPPAPPSFFQRVETDGTARTDWVKVGALGAVVLVTGFLLLRRRGRK
jgi:hypothetical protein